MRIFNLWEVLVILQSSWYEGESVGPSRRVFAEKRSLQKIRSEVFQWVQPRCCPMPVFEFDVFLHSSIITAVHIGGRKQHQKWAHPRTMEDLQYLHTANVKLYAENFWLKMFFVFFFEFLLKRKENSQKKRRSAKVKRKCDSPWTPFKLVEDLQVLHFENLPDDSVSASRFKQQVRQVVLRGYCEWELPNSCCLGQEAHFTETGFLPHVLIGLTPFEGSVDENSMHSCGSVLYAAVFARAICAATI